MPDPTEGAKPRRNPILSAEVITVLPDAVEKRCASCDVLCYWGENRNGKRVPVDCRYQELLPDARLEPPIPEIRTVYGTQRGQPGRGISHFYTCPNAHQHSRKGHG